MTALHPTSPNATEFLRRLTSCILDHLEDEGFGVEELARLIHLSRGQLFRKVKALTGRGVACYIRRVRTGEAKRLLDMHLSVMQIACLTGFTDTSCLRKAFLLEMGETLAQYRRRLGRRG